MPLVRKNVFDTKSPDFSRKQFTDWKFWKRVAFERQELEYSIARKLRRHAHDIYEEIMSVTSYKDPNLLKSLELELNNMIDRAAASEESGNAYQTFYKHLEKEISADIVDPHYAEELSSYNQAIKSFNKAEKDVTLAKEKIGRKEKRLLKLVTSKVSAQDERRKHLDETIRAAHELYHRNIKVKDSILKSVIEISDNTLAAWKDWEEDKLCFLLADWRACIDLQRESAVRNKVLASIDAISLDEMVDRLAELKMKEAVTVFQDADDSEDNENPEKQSPSTPEGCPQQERAPDSTERSESATNNIKRQQTPRWPNGEVCKELVQSESSTKPRKGKSAAVGPTPEHTFIRSEDTVVTMVEVLSSGSDTDSNSLDITCVLKKSDDDASSKNDCKSDVTKSDIKSSIKQEESIEEIVCQEDKRKRRTPIGQSPKTFLKISTPSPPDNDLTNFCENDPWSLFISKSDTASNEGEVTAVQEIKSAADFQKSSSKQQRCPKQPRKQRNSRPDGVVIQRRKQPDICDQVTSVCVEERVVHGAEDQPQVQHEQQHQRRQQVKRRQIRTRHSGANNCNKPPEQCRQQEVQESRCNTSWNEVSELVVIKDYIKRSNKEISLRIGQKVVQLCPPNSKGMAYGYKKKLIPNSRRGYYPASCVIQETKS